MKLLYLAFYFLLCLPFSAIASIPIASPQFENLCKTDKQECNSIRIHAKLATDLIYQFFQADRLNDKIKLEQASQQIKDLLGIPEIKVINRRIPLSQFFPVNSNIIFGGYALFGQNYTMEANTVVKAQYYIIVKGVFNELEDPNDLLAAISGIPANLYGKTGITLHQGMKNYAQQILLSNEFQSLLTEILNLQSEKVSVEVILSGHSLGGSCILLGALMTDRGVKPENIKMITFGAPLFLQRGFIDRYNFIFPRTIRVEIEGDMLNNEVNSPLFPVYRLLGYLPFGRLVKGTVPDSKYKQIQAEVNRLSRGELNEDKLIKLTNLQLESLSDRVRIHVFGYRSFFDNFSGAVSD